MNCLNDYLAARKAYLDKIVPLKPSNMLKTFVEEEKCRGLAKVMDDVDGKQDKMKLAVKDYDGYYKVYLGKIAKQIQAEKVDHTKLKTPFETYRGALESISKKYAVRVNESEHTQSTDQLSAEKNLKRALDDFKGKRTAHLNAITPLHDECVQQLVEVKKWHATARDAVAKALTAAKIGDLGTARKVADEAKAAAQRAAETAAGAQKAYTERIHNVYMKDRDLGFSNYEKSHGLLKNQEGGFKDGQKAVVEIFDRATKFGKETLELIKTMDALAKQAAEAAASANDAAGVKDIRPALRTSLQTAQKDVDEIKLQIMTKIEASRKGQGNLITAESILADAKNPQLHDRAVKEAALRIKLINDQLEQLTGLAARLKSVANNQIQKFPQDYKGQEEFKTALAKLGGDTGETTMAFNEWAKDCRAAIEKLAAIK